MVADPELLGPGMEELLAAVASLNSLLNQMSHNQSISQPTTEEFEEAAALLTTITDSALVVEENTAAAT